MLISSYYYFGNIASLAKRYAKAREVLTDWEIDNSPLCILAPESVNFRNDIAFRAYCKSPQLRNVVKWINRKICYNVGLDDPKTLLVRLRVACSMINKLDLELEESINIYENLKERLHVELYELVQEQVRKEMDELPF